MRAIIKPHKFSGAVRIPASKSHTIRQLLIAALADGVSGIRYPLDSLDAQSCAGACRALGADIEEHRAADPLCPNPAGPDGNRLVAYTVRGCGGRLPPRAGAQNAAPRPIPVDVGNSGTTLYLALAAAALDSRAFVFDGDEQIRRRGAGPLLEALAALGVRAESKDSRGCAPITIQGPWKGGRARVSCPTSQYLSALLIAAPLAPAGVVTEIDVPLLNEKPYIEMTLSYLKAQGVHCEAAPDFSRFVIPGGAVYKPVSAYSPGDFSSAAFPGCAAALTGGPVTLFGLDPEDTQGDKAYFDMLGRMGCKVEWKRLSGEEHAAGGAAGWALAVSRDGPLRGGVFALNATPDMLPAAAVTAACAEGDTALVNVAHARIKETDRIAVMAEELGKLGVDCTERPDGLVVHGRAGPGKGGAGKAPFRGGVIDGHGDHRVVMAFAAAALAAEAPVEIEGAESAAVTYPGFLELLGARM
ncbi:MAG: 3-phosphoshikimate 1-carboxyvinyltransferase [Treponema sp.]|jgi:3-phosphoshikimate 1-carboxyvinyltransferase|nr:3-phosphoshikimate 1-carboxyvinyltransferase [Treponema sp.]